MDNKILLIVDAQVDFTTGRLGSEQAAKVSRKLQDYVRDHGRDYRFVLATLDTHSIKEFTNSNTVEGTEVPRHCILASPGYALVGDLADHVDFVLEKSTFMAEGFSCLEDTEREDSFPVEEIDVCGFCTDICVISNALLLRRDYPTAKIRVLDDLCAGTSEHKHQAALDVMESCLIEHCSSESLAK